MLGNRTSLENLIHYATGISLLALRGRHDLCHKDEIVSWVQNRKARYEEDIFYSLFGIFNVYTFVSYGEGKENAYRRLMDEFSQKEARER